MAERVEGVDGDAWQPPALKPGAAFLRGLACDLMAEVLVEFQGVVTAPDGTAYEARACGGAVGDGSERWHGWIEFDPLQGGPAIRTPRETTQRDRADTESWASRLTCVYLEGALQRALYHRIPVEPARSGRALRASDGGRRRSRSRVAASGPERRAAAAPTGFARVGGMPDLKAQVRRIVQTIHVQQEDARRYGIVRNGILLYGPPGCGKTFFVQAMAEEFGLRLERVSLEHAVGSFTGSPPDAMAELFRKAAASTPCLLFFDEFDAIACKRQNAAALHEQQMVDALLQQLDLYRETPGILIVAATNRFDDLDPAVIREGRFDYKIRIDSPDFDARLEILRALLGYRPHEPRLDLVSLAHDLEDFSAAQIRSLVDEAALTALEARVPIGDDHLRSAYHRHAAASRYGGVRAGWDDLVLPGETKRKLQLIEKLIESPQVVRELGITPPRGILLTGPPGTGKTTIARVLASETEASFLAVNAADVFSKWLGESERHVKELFEQARTRVPAIVFLDEIDAIADRRSDADSGGDRARNAVVNVLLAEMDGLDSSARIFVIGATNRPELIDEALLRPGRLGETIEVGLPDAAGRRALLELFTRKMRLAPSVDLSHLADRLKGASGADLRGLCTLAGRNALMRELEARGPAQEARIEAAPAVTRDDFEQAMRELSSREARRRPIGFHPPEEMP